MSEERRREGGGDEGDSWAASLSRAFSRPTSRRRFLLGSATGAVAGLALTGGASAYEARYVNPYRPELERRDLLAPADQTGRPLAGLRIAFLADTHVGPFISPDDLARATAIIAAERPDLVLLGGDYISDSPRHAGLAAEVLGELVRDVPLGGFGVLGNHDISTNADQVIRAMAENGITILVNQATEIATGRGALWIAGMDDALIGQPDPEAAFAGIPAGAATIALWHEPDWAERSAALGAFAQLSGHSHGGQVRLPGIGPLRVPEGAQRYPIGLNHAAGMPIYTARGVGVYRPPVRLNCPPEVTLITLTETSA